MTCRFCSAETSVACDWPALEAKLTPVPDIRHGDVLVDWNGQRFAVVDIEHDGPMRVALTISLIGSKRKPERIVKSDWDRIGREGEGRCGAPCCELHHRELDQRFHVCMDHWSSWLTTSEGRSGATDRSGRNV